MRKHRTPTPLVFAVALLCVACPKDEERASAENAPPTGTPSMSAAPTPSASAASAVPDKPPTVAFRRYLEKELPGRVAIFPTQSAVFVGHNDQVGRLVGDKVEWIGTVPKGNPAYGGDSIVSWVGGRFPDSVDATYFSNNGRAPVPTYTPVTGKGEAQAFAAGGGMGGVVGAASVGETTFIIGYSYEGYTFIRVRGPMIARAPTPPKAAGCTDEEAPPNGMRKIYGVTPEAFGASPDGTMFSVGRLCDKRGPAAEVWDKDSGVSKIHKLDGLVKEVGWSAQLLFGKGSTAWIVQPDSPVVAYENGAFVGLPPLDKIARAFVAGDLLHASDGHGIFRYEGGKWTKVLDLTWASRDASYALHEGAFYAADRGSLFKLEPTEPLEMKDGCTTPFVFLYDVSPKSEPNYSFPTTRKALSTFDKLDRIGLVEFDENGRRLGITVPDKALGEAVIAHVVANMKDEKPRLICYQPKAPRTIKLDKNP
ncbi:MAG: hypothetical protein HOV80_30255 [Polyangiaceae bacterium]|nr:hypothetical protein [Polyangiaceae bacterium]